MFSTEATSPHTAHSICSFARSFFEPDGCSFRATHADAHADAHADENGDWAGGAAAACWNWCWNVSDSGWCACGAADGPNPAAACACELRSIGRGGAEDAIDSGEESDASDPIEPNALAAWRSISSPLNPPPIPIVSPPAATLNRVGGIDAVESVELEDDMHVACSSDEGACPSLPPPCGPVVGHGNANC